MTFAIVSVCAASPKVPIEAQHKVELFSCEEKMALITDVFLAALTLAVAVLVILATKGIHLGQLSGIGSIGMNAAYIMIGVAGGILLIDVIKLLVQMVRHISRLFDINSRLVSDKSAAGLEQKVQFLEQEKTALTAAETALKKELALLEKSKTNELAILQGKMVETESEARSAIQTGLKTFEQTQAKSTKKIEELENEISLLKQQISQGANEAAQQQIKVLEIAKLDLETKLKIQGQLDEVNAQLATKQAELQEFCEKILQPQVARLDELKKQQLALEQEIEQKTQQSEAAAKLSEAAAKNLYEETRSQAQELASQIEKDAIAQASQKTEAAELQRNQLIIAIKELEAHITHLRDQVLAKLTAETQDLQKTIAQHKQEIEQSNLQKQQILDEAQRIAGQIKLQAMEEGNRIIEEAKVLPAEATKHSIQAITEAAQRQAGNVIAEAEKKANMMLEDAKNQAEALPPTLAKQINELQAHKRQLEKDIIELGQEQLKTLASPRTIIKKFETTTAVATSPKLDDIMQEVSTLLNNSDVVNTSSAQDVLNTSSGTDMLNISSEKEEEEVEQPQVLTEVEQPKLQQDDIATALTQAMTFQVTVNKKQVTYNLAQLSFEFLEGVNPLANTVKKRTAFETQTKQILSYHKKLTQEIQELAVQIGASQDEKEKVEQIQTLTKKCEEMKGYLSGFIKSNTGKSKLSITPINFFNKAKQ